MEEQHQSQATQEKEEGPILTPEDHKFFEDNGYLVIHNAVPQENLDAVISAIFSYLNMDPKDPDDWYHPPLERNGFVNMYHHQAMWNVRQNERLYKIFCELWGTQKLWVSIDRCCLKPPNSARYPHYQTKGFVHWDVDPWDTNNIPFALQGVLCLTDTSPHQGGYHCIPGMHKYLKTWIKNYPAPKREREKWTTGGIPIRFPEKALKRPSDKLKLVVIDAKAGDLIVWRRELAHGNGCNKTNLPRLAQYVTFYPARDPTDQRRLTPQESLDPDGQSERIRLWKTNQAPSKFGRHQDPWGAPAELTELGKKLLGLEPWDEDQPEDEEKEK